MKKYILRPSGIAAMAVMLSTSVFAQIDEKDKPNKWEKMMKRS